MRTIARRYLHVLAAAVALAGTGCSATPGQVAETPGPAASPVQSLRNAVDDYGVNMARCLTDKGWEVTVSADGGVGGSFPNEQADRYRADLEACRDDLGYSTLPATTEEDAGRLFDHLIEVADCVRDLGYEVHEPPSRRAYVEGILNNQLPWHPYSAVFELGPNAAAQRELEANCPIENP